MEIMKKVYITGYGLRPFQVKEVVQLNPDLPKQFKGRYKLPKNVSVVNGKKWIDLDYYFTEKEIK